MAKEKIKDVPKVKVPEQVRQRYQPEKKGQSTFDKILEQNRMLQKTPQQNQSSQLKGRDESHRVVRHQDQEGGGKDRKSDDKEQERGKQKAKEERKPGTENGERIGGKGQKKGSSDKGSGGDQRGGRGYGRSFSKRQVATLKKSALSKAGQAALKSSKFASQLQAKAKAAHLSREFIQKVVNQIVKFMKSGVNPEGEKEVRLDLRETIFRGLRLRIATKRDKVSVHFDASNPEVRELFASNAENIQKELEAKGVAVAEIKVT